MSGPVRTDDVPPSPQPPEPPPGAVLEITRSRDAEVGGHQVRRALPRRSRRTVGAWCFADHMAPFSVTEASPGLGVGPHPHMGLQTVTWLLAGELLHRDSLGSEQTIRPGQLNLMTAGRGISHAEESIGGYRGPMHGIQLWVAQPEATRHGDAEFEHHTELPRVAVGSGTATVLVGGVGDTTSAARRDTDHIGVDLDLHAGQALLPIRPAHEHALIVLAGAVQVAGEVVTPGHLAYLGLDRSELALRTDDAARALLIGGLPFEAPILMWWNFVARSRDEVDAAQLEWNERGPRFGDTGSPMERIPAPIPPWRPDPR